MGTPAGQQAVTFWATAVQVASLLSVPPLLLVEPLLLVDPLLEVEPLEVEPLEVEPLEVEVLPVAPAEPPSPPPSPVPQAQTKLMRITPRTTKPRSRRMHRRVSHAAGRPQAASPTVIHEAAMDLMSLIYISTSRGERNRRPSGSSGSFLRLMTSRQSA